jgi:hypothetical protein
MGFYGCARPWFCIRCFQKFKGNAVHSKEAKQPVRCDSTVLSQSKVMIPSVGAGLEQCPILAASARLLFRRLSDNQIVLLLARSLWVNIK